MFEYDKFEYLRNLCEDWTMDGGYVGRGFIGVNFGVRRHGSRSRWHLIYIEYKYRIVWRNL